MGTFLHFIGLFSKNWYKTVSFKKKKAFSISSVYSMGCKRPIQFSKIWYAVEAAYNNTFGTGKICHYIRCVVIRPITDGNSIMKDSLGNGLNLKCRNKQ